MIGCLRTRVRKQPIIALYFESENVLRFYNLEARWKQTLQHKSTRFDSCHNDLFKNSRASKMVNEQRMVTQ